MNLITQTKGSAKDEWQTPECVLERVRKVAPIALDPASQIDNPTKAATWFVRDGELQDWCSWTHDGLAFVNPPYSRGNLVKWMAKCVDEAAKGCEIIALVPVDTSTVWWGYCAPPASQAVCFWRGRLRFVGAVDGPASFASAVVYFGPNKYRFADAFADVGSIWL